MEKLRYYCPTDEVTIVRESTRANLYDAEIYLGSFPGEWSDEQIKMALDFANLAYDCGVKSGERAKATEIRQALGM
jgi:hypothetical protein